jgi:hypothetical protein
MKEEINKILNQLVEKNETIETTSQKLFELFKSKKSFYCHDEANEGRCDKQCRWCMNNEPENWIEID